MRYYSTASNMAAIKKIYRIKCWWTCRAAGTSTYVLLVQVQIRTITLENGLPISDKAEHLLLCDLAFLSLLYIQQKSIYIWTVICISLKLRTAHISINSRMDKLRYFHMMQYYTAMKMRTLLRHRTVWMKPTNMMLKEARPKKVHSIRSYWLELKHCQI